MTQVYRGPKSQQKCICIYISICYIHILYVLAFTFIHVYISFFCTHREKCCRNNNILHPNDIIAQTKISFMKITIFKWSTSKIIFILQKILFGAAYCCIYDIFSLCVSIPQSSMACLVIPTVTIWTIIYVAFIQ